jgi:methanogenic corrinoid protein MtbC1
MPASYQSPLHLLAFLQISIHYVLHGDKLISGHFNESIREVRMSKELTDAIVGMNEEEAMRLVLAMLDGGADPGDVLEEAKGAMTVLGDKFECEEVFIPELIMGGEIMKRIADELKPRIKGEASGPSRGTIVLGTVAGDIHDIGKDVVVLMLDVNGYDVHDLGIDVSVEKFIAAIDELDPQVIGLSGLLTLAFDSMKATIEGIAAAGKRDQVRIMIGGSPVDEQICTYTGADGWGRDAAAALRLAAEWTGGAA